MKKFNKVFEEKQKPDLAREKYSFFLFCELHGLLSMLTVRTTIRAPDGKLTTFDKNTFWILEDEIRSQGELSENQKAYRTSFSCRCERGQAYYEAREQKPEMLDVRLYEEFKDSVKK